MKRGLPLSWTAALLFLLFLSVAPQPAAASGADLQVSHSFDKRDYIQTETGNITLMIKNTSDAQVVIKSVIIRTDWQTPDEFFENKTPTGHVLNTTGDTCQVQVAFNVSCTAEVIDHSWSISIIYEKGGLDKTLYWTSENLTDLKVSGFEIVVSPESMTIFPGQNAVFSVTVVGMNEFSKEVVVRSDCWPWQHPNKPWLNTCYPSLLWGTGGSTLTVKTEPSTKTGTYSVEISAYCPNGTTKFQQGAEVPVISQVAYAKLTVDPRPKAFIDVSANCLAQGGIAAILVIAVLTAALFAAEMRRKSKKA